MRVSKNSSSLKNFETEMMHPMRNRETPLATRKSQVSKSPTAPPYFNIKIFDSSDESALEDHEKPERNSPINANGPGKTFDDEDEHGNGRLSRSHSLDDNSPRSSAYSRRNRFAPRDVLTRRHALDAGGVHHLRSYMRIRKNSIVQRVIGYNYDDHSTAGGLYIRVGIGSKRSLSDIE